MRRAVFSILVIITASVLVLAERPPVINQLRVGSRSIDPGVLHPYTVRYKETIVSVQNIILERAIWTDQLQKISVDGHDAWRRHIEVVTPEGKFRETVDLIVDATTFAPLRTTEKNINGSMEFSFGRTHLNGERVTQPNSPPRSIHAQFGEPAFDYYGGMMELFFALLPFKDGYRATFPAVMATTGPEADPKKIDWPIIEVKGEETLTVGGVKYQAWRVEANTQYGFYRVWVRKEKPFVVRTILLIPLGGRIIYDIIPDPISS